MDLEISFFAGGGRELGQGRKEGAQLPTAPGTLLIQPLGTNKGTLLNSWMTGHALLFFFDDGWEWRLASGK